MSGHYSTPRLLDHMPFYLEISEHYPHLSSLLHFLKLFNIKIIKPFLYHLHTVFLSF